MAFLLASIGLLVGFLVVSLWLPSGYLCLPFGSLSGDSDLMASVRLSSGFGLASVRPCQAFNPSCSGACSSCLLRFCVSLVLVDSSSLLVLFSSPPHLGVLSSHLLYVRSFPQVVVLFSCSMFVFFASSLVLLRSASLLLRVLVVCRLICIFWCCLLPARLSLVIALEPSCSPSCRASLLCRVLLI